MTGFLDLWRVYIAPSLVQRIGPIVSRMVPAGDPPAVLLQQVGPRAVPLSVTRFAAGSPEELSPVSSRPRQLNRNRSRSHVDRTRIHFSRPRITNARNGARGAGRLPDCG